MAISSCALWQVVGAVTAEVQVAAAEDPFLLLLRLHNLQPLETLLEGEVHWFQHCKTFSILQQDTGILFCAP